MNSSKFIDYRSDTVTFPTDEMREAMKNALVGDDVYEDDETTIKLQRLAAEVTGKEDSIFVPSGTFGNQLSLFTHCQRGNEVILGEDCHIVQHEVGASSVIAGVQLRTLKSDNGLISPEDVKKTIRGENIHFPETGLICLENAHSNGRVIPLSIMKSIRDISLEHNIPIHLDGARLFNAAAALNVNPKEITKYADSVMFCLSKGLCAPIGSMLCGSHDFIIKAKKKRKLMGGGLRQTGVLAAPGIIAIEKMTKRLAEDHKNARYLGSLLSEIDGISADISRIEINMVYFTMSFKNLNSVILKDELLKRNIKINEEENGEMRFVTNYWVTKEDIEFTIECIKDLIQKYE
jgi:threonine aldolase